MSFGLLLLACVRYGRNLLFYIRQMVSRQLPVDLGSKDVYQALMCRSLTCTDATSEKAGTDRIRGFELLAEFGSNRQKIMLGVGLGIPASKMRTTGLRCRLSQH